MKNFFPTTLIHLWFVRFRTQRQRHDNSRRVLIFIMRCPRRKVKDTSNASMPTFRPGLSSSKQTKYRAC